MLGATTTQRLRLQKPGNVASPQGASSVHWDTPPGWTELPPSSLRQANFRVAGRDDAECYLTLLAGDGGGVVANVNRWRKQMSLAPLDDTEVAALPRATLLSNEGALIDVEGEWVGMGGDASEQGWRLVGIAAAGSGQGAFLKMVGPADAIAAERDAFLALAASMHSAASHGGGGETAHEPSATPARRTSGLTWTAPPGWQQAPDRAMREVTFKMGADGETAECYVAVLGGEGGGVLPNINRWRSQLGADALSDADAEELDRLPMLGVEGIVVDAAGSFEGMAGERYEEALLFGAVCLLPDRSVFVKLVGPSATVGPEREAFIAFCQSLEYEQGSQ